MIEPTWDTRELPILQYVLARLDAGASEVGLGEIAKETGLEPRQVQVGAYALVALMSRAVQGWDTEPARTIVV